MSTHPSYIPHWWASAPSCWGFEQVSTVVGQEFGGETRGTPSIQTQPSHPKCDLLQFISAARELIRNILLLLHFEGWVICQLPPCYLPADGLVQNTWGRRTQMGNQNRILQHLTCTCEPIYSVFLQVKNCKGIFLFGALRFTVENYLEWYSLQCTAWSQKVTARYSKCRIDSRLQSWGSRGWREHKTAALLLRSFL